MTINIYSRDGKIVGKRELSLEIFGLSPNNILIYEAITMYKTNKRRGTSSTKTRGEARGGGKKPWRQKHTGRARAGSRRSPIWVGGGRAFGPKPKDWSYTISKKKKLLALKQVLSQRANNGKILCLENLDFRAPKTREFAELLEIIGRKASEKYLFLYTKSNENLYKSGRNIKGIGFKRIMDLNTLDIMSFDTLVFTPDGLDQLEERLK